MAINNTGCIPMPHICQINGEKVYVRKVCLKDFMIKYQGFGISEHILRDMNEKLNIVFIYQTMKPKSKITRYKCSVWAFINSDKRFKNDKDDWQRFVSIKDMGIINEA